MSFHVSNEITNIGVLGGLRIEARVKANCLGDAVSKFMRKKPWIFNCVVADASVSVRGIDVCTYARKCKMLLMHTRQVLLQLGHSRMGVVDAGVKRVFGDLKSMIGYATHNYYCALARYLFPSHLYPLIVLSTYLRHSTCVNLMDEFVLQNISETVQYYKWMSTESQI